MNIGLKEILIKNNINDCDILYVASSGFAIYWDKKFVHNTIDTLIELMKNKTLVMPSFSFDFCDNGIYDVNKSPTYCGIVSSNFMHRKDVKRTIHTPMHNVSIFGEKQFYFLSQVYETSFGHNSFFEDLEKFNTGVLLIDCSFNDGVPFIHCLEEKNGCTYRDYKIFKGKVIDSEGKTIDYTFKRYVRNGSAIPEFKSEEFVDKYAVKFKYEHSYYIYFKLKDFYNFYLKEKGGRWYGIYI